MSDDKKLQKSKKKAVKKVKPPKAPKKKDETPRPDVQIGDLVIDDRGDIYKVEGFSKKEPGVRLDHNRWNDDGQWTHYGTIDYEKFDREYTKLTKPIDEYRQELVLGMGNNFVEYESDDTQSTSTEVALSGGKEQAISLKKSLEQATNKLTIMTALMNRERDKLLAIQRDFKDKLEQITKVVDIIELYLGVSEEIVQIQQGEPASYTDPICFRQLVLHMDEEVGDEEDGGLDWEKIEVFDDWFRKNTNQVLPESKGIVVVRPRRDEKDYRMGDDLLARLSEHERNKPNFYTYILIRNGDNLYRIWTSKIRIYPHLFPGSDEIRKLNVPEEELKWNSDKEKQENTKLAYKRNVLMLQGLMDRTNIFKPIPEGLNLLNPDTYGDKVRFIYDGSNTLTDGKPSFDVWLKEQNKNLKRGDRVYFVGYPYHLFSQEYRRSSEAFRFPIPGWTNRPGSGIYNVKRLEDVSSRYSGERHTLICHHNPKDKVYKKQYTWYGRNSGYEDATRKMSIPFRLVPHEDDFFINYEAIKENAGDIDFYINDRVNRHRYLDMMPVLKGLKKMIKEEKEWEDGFIRLLKSQLGDDKEQKIRDGIAWWKTKVIEKRPLNREDAKAVRMISDYVKRQK